MTDYALCPFYEYEKKGKIKCEANNFTFPSKQDKGMWLKMHCSSWNFKICKFYKQLAKKYDSDI